jgi:ferric-dicitrate binding protein FerR (iron transport regulator)
MAPDLRVSDADRDGVVAELRDHFAAGRLAEDELGERIAAAYAARTAGELAALRADLPDPRAQLAAPTPRELARRRVHHDLGAVALVDVGCVAVWLAIGAHGSFWPAWVILGTALAVAYDCWHLLGPTADQVRPDYRTWVERHLRF